MKKVLLLLFTVGLLTHMARAEGSREFERSNPSRPCKIDFLNPVHTLFGSYRADETERIYFRIANPSSEAVYMGFGKQFYGSFIWDTLQLAPVYMRIKDPAGNIVFGPIQLNNDAPGTVGYINNSTQAYAGPAPLNPNGYNPISFVPTVAGDYYVEFNVGDPEIAATGFLNNFKMLWFDVTVYNTQQNQEIRGRLWSRTWELSALNSRNFVNTNFFIYTTDSITSRMEINEMQPFGFIVRASTRGGKFSNQFFEARQSQDDKTLVAEHRLFLNSPDPVQFPNGVLTQLTNPITVTGCLASGYCVNVNVTKGTYTEFHINLDGVPGYQAGGRDVFFSEYLNAGPNCVNWDGNDGLGQPLVTGDTLIIDGELVTGLTNFTIYDAHYNLSGFRAFLVRPGTPGQIPLFWDDTEIPGGQTNLTGCLTACHTWNFAFDSISPTLPFSRGFGDERSINTWYKPYYTYFNTAIVFDDCIIPAPNFPPIARGQVVTMPPDTASVTVDPNLNNTPVTGNINRGATTITRQPTCGTLTIDALGV